MGHLNILRYPMRPPHQTFVTGGGCRRMADQLRFFPDHHQQHRDRDRVRRYPHLRQRPLLSQEARKRRRRVHAYPGVGRGERRPGSLPHSCFETHSSCWVRPALELLWPTVRFGRHGIRALGGPLQAATCIIPGVSLERSGLGGIRSR